MNRNFISYSLFKPKKFYEHRTWDKDNFNEERYFFNIPSLCAVNKILYPEFSTHLYVCPETEKHPLFEFYKQLSIVNDSFSYSVIEENYSGHEPALWRVKLLWKKGVGTFLSRDLDSLPNKEEYQSTRFFENSDYSVHTIRSHENHFNYPCRMLMGMSAFKPDRIPQEILTNSFEDFKSKYSLKPELLADPTIKWNSDQLIVINAFTNNDFFTSDHFLDSKINNQTHYQDFFCNIISDTELNSIKINSNQSMILDLIHERSLTSWAGEPSDARREFLTLACEIENSLPILDIINQNSLLKQFYFS